MRWGRELAAIQHSKQTAWTIRDRSCSLPLAVVVVVVVAVVVAKYPPLCLDLSGSGWVRRIRCCGKPAEYCETAYLLPVFSPGMQSAAAPCAGTPISCLVYTAFRDRRPGLAAATRWRSAAGVGAGSGLGKRRKRGGKVDSTFIMSALRLEGWPEPGREGLERESQRLRAPAACRGRATTTQAADSLRRRNGDKSWALPMASERSGRSGIGCPVALSGQGSVVWTKIQTTCQHHLDLCRLTSCTTRVPLSCLTDGQAAKSTRPKTCHLKVS